MFIRGRRAVQVLIEEESILILYEKALKIRSRFVWLEGLRISSNRKLYLICVTYCTKNSNLFFKTQILISCFYTHTHKYKTSAMFPDLQF